MLAFTLTLLQLATAAAPDPIRRDQVVLLRSFLQPLTVVAPDGVRALGPREAAGFPGAPPDARLRLLAASAPLGLAVVEVAGIVADGTTVGALYTLDAAAPDAPPVRLVSTRGVDLDVALSPDGRRLFYSEGDEPSVVSLVPPYGVARIATFSPLPANLPDRRVENPRWLDDQTIAFVVTTTHKSGVITSTIESAPADGSERAHLLVPKAAAQDRLAAVVGAHVLFYRDGALWLQSPGADPKRIGDRHLAGVAAPWPNLEGRVASAVIMRGEGGVTRPIALERLDADGTLHPLAPRRTAYLDPLVSPARGYLTWSVETPAGFVVERVALADGATKVVAAPAADPIELVTHVPGSSWIAGCRGTDVVLVDTRGVEPVRTIARAPDNASCTVRGATTSHVLFDRKRNDAHNDFVLALAPVDPAGAVIERPGASATLLLGRAAVAQTGWSGVTSLVVERGPAVTTLVPWQDVDIADPLRAPDGVTVTYRIAGDASWRAARTDRIGANGAAVVDVTGPLDSPLHAVGLVGDRLVGHDMHKSRTVSYRLDGRDRGAPVVVLEGTWPGILVPDLGLVVGMTPDGRVLSAPVDGSGRTKPTDVLKGVSLWTRSMAYDRAHHRIVAVSDVGGIALLAADVRGTDVAAPKLIGRPSPSDERAIGDIAIGDHGLIVVSYHTRLTGGIHPAGVEVFAADGSGLVKPPPELPADPVDDDRATRTVIE